MSDKEQEEVQENSKNNLSVEKPANKGRATSDMSRNPSKNMFTNSSYSISKSGNLMKDWRTFDLNYKSSAKLLTIAFFLCCLAIDIN